MPQMIAYRNCFLLIALLGLNACETVNDSPVILQATHDGGSNTCSFLFHQDNTYEWFNGSGLGVFTKNGKYTIRDSIITLDRLDIDKPIISKNLLVRTQKALWDSNKVVTYIFQVDEATKVIDTAKLFVVYVDNRHK